MPGQLDDFGLGYDMMDRVGAIVLGGGQGTRLHPLTKVRAKPAVPLCGRYRLVDIPLSNCIHSGIKRIVVLTQFNSHSLNRHITQTYRFDAFTKGYVEVLSAEQTGKFASDWFQGTADAVRKQLVHIRDLNAEHYIILSGDQLYRMDYRTLMATHLKHDADITVSALQVNPDSAGALGIMQVDVEGRIQRFVEKPSDPETLEPLKTPESLFTDFGLDGAGKPYLASMGVYAFKAEVLEQLLIENPDWDDFGKELLPNAIGARGVFAHMFSGFWEDIGTVRSYFDVSMALTSLQPPFEFHEQQRQIFTHLRALPGVKIMDATVRNAIICEGSRITRATINDAIIGIRSIVHPGADINRAIILGAEYFEDEVQAVGKTPIGIGPDARISNAIIDHNARVGSGAVIRGDASLPDSDAPDYCVRDGIVVVHKNAVVPDGAVIGAV